MRRSVVSRVLSLFGALLMASSASGLALAHGSAHVSAAEHEWAHERAHAAELAALHVVTDGPAIEEADHDDHAHLDIGSALTPRFSSAPFLGSPVIGFVLTSEVRSGTEPPTSAVVERPDERPPGSSRQPRAPPLG